MMELRTDKTSLYYSILLILSCLFFILAAPVFNPEVHRQVFNFGYFLIIISALLCAGVSTSRLIFVVLAFLLQVIGLIFELPFIQTLANLVIFAYFSLIVVHLVFLIAKVEAVSPLILLNAISVYLLLGINFFLCNVILYSFSPESIPIPEGDNGFMGELIYYTFVTFTTVGYGDITPETTMAHSLAIASAMCGQMYLTLVIAIIVGKYLNQPDSSRQT